jgi:hypothetical protein
VAIFINILFHLLHFINTHVTYDGLAQDVSISFHKVTVSFTLTTTGSSFSDLHDVFGTQGLW